MAVWRTCARFLCIFGRCHSPTPWSVTPTTVYNVEYMHWTRAENIWLSPKSLVGGYHIGSKMAVFKWPLYPLCQTPMCMPPPAAHIEAHEPNQVRAVMFMLSIASWNFWLGPSRLVRGTCIGSKLASYCHIETHREPTPQPPPSCPLDNEVIIWHPGTYMMRIHLVLLGYTHMEWIYEKKSIIAIICAP